MDISIFKTKASKCGHGMDLIDLPTDTFAANRVGSRSKILPFQDFRKKTFNMKEGVWVPRHKHKNKLLIPLFFPGCQYPLFPSPIIKPLIWWTIHGEEKSWWHDWKHGNCMYIKQDPISVSTPSVFCTMLKLSFEASHLCWRYHDHQQAACEVIFC